MRTVLVSDLVTRVRNRAGIVSAAQFIRDGEIRQYLSDGWARVYGILCESGEPYFLNQPPTLFSSVAGQDTYYTTSSSIAPAGTNLLPTDLYKIRGLDAQLSTSGEWRNLHRYEFEERNDFQVTYQAGFWPTEPRYDFQGMGANAAIRFMPAPQAASPLRLWYYPSAPDLTVATSIDGGNAWDVYAVDYAANYCAVKDENFDLLPALAASMAQIEAAIRTESANRNAGLPRQVRRSPRYKTGMGPWGRRW